MKITFIVSQGIRLEGSSDASSLQFSSIQTQICLAWFTKFTWCQQVTLVGHTTWIPDLVNMSPVHAPSQLLHKHWISLGQRSDCWPAVKVFLLGRLSLWLTTPPFWYLSWWYNKQKSWSLCSWSIYNVWVYIDINLNCSSFHPDKSTILVCESHSQAGWAMWEDSVWWE